MVTQGKNSRGTRRTLTAVVGVDDARQVLDALSEEIDRLEQDALCLSLAERLRRLFVIARGRLNSDGLGGLPKARNCNCRRAAKRPGARADDAVPAGGTPPAPGDRLTATIRAFAARLGAADGAERDTAIREFCRWADLRCGTAA